MQTCHSYCNSIIQCLYYSQPFREHVINFPARSSIEPIRQRLTKAPTAADRIATAAKNSHADVQGSTSPRTKQAPGVAAGQQQKTEENKDAPDYKKKMAMERGPVLNLNYDNAKSYGMEDTLFASLKDIFEAIIAHDSRMGVVSPQRFLETLRSKNEMFRTPMHQDAHEFLNLLLNQVVENVEEYARHNQGVAHHNGNANGAINGNVNGASQAVTALNGALWRTNTSGTKLSSRWVHELFEGTLTSETRCLTCETVSQRDEAFLDLSVDLENHNSVTSCLRRFSEEEMLCERNKFHCDKCSGLQEAEKRMKIKRLPRILALHLKRFKYTEDMQKLLKLFHRVVYPFYLRLFNTTDDAEDPDRLYELYAVVVHIGGGPYHGHYVAIIKTEDRGWLLFDDEMVEPVDKRYVLKFFGEGVDGMNNPKNLACAYVLFYQETTMEAMQRELDSEGIPPEAMAAEAQQEPFAVKPNGSVANSAIHFGVPGTPITEESEHFAALDHAMTAPAIGGPTPPLSNVPFPHPLEHVPSSPNLPFLKRKKSQSEALAKAEQKRLQKEQQRLEKEEKERRKVEEKEMERQAKMRKHEAEAARKEAAKRQEEELAQRSKHVGLIRTNTATNSSFLSTAATNSYANTIASSSNTSWRAEDDESHISTPDMPSTPTGLGLQTEEREHVSSPTSHPQTGLHAGVSPTAAGTSTNMLHRFRNTSMSLRQKPAFWSRKDKDKDKEKPRRSEDMPVQPVTPDEQLNESLLAHEPPLHSPYDHGQYAQSHQAHAHPHLVSPHLLSPHLHLHPRPPPSPPQAYPAQGYLVQNHPAHSHTPQFHPAQAQAQAQHTLFPPQLHPASHPHAHANTHPHPHPHPHPPHLHERATSSPDVVRDKRGMFGIGRKKSVDLLNRHNWLG